MVADLAGFFCCSLVLSWAAHVCLMKFSLVTQFLIVVFVNGYLVHVRESRHLYWCSTYFFLCYRPDCGACLTSNQYRSLVSYWSIHYCSATSCLVYWWPHESQFSLRSWGTLPLWTRCNKIMFDEFWPPDFGQGLREWSMHKLVVERIGAFVSYGSI